MGLVSIIEGSNPSITLIRMKNFNVHDVTNKLEKTFFWMNESEKYALRGDIHYSGICFEKAYLIAEELLEMHTARETFLTYSEKEYLDLIVGNPNQ